MHSMSRVSILGIVLLTAFYGGINTAWGQVHFRDRGPIGWAGGWGGAWGGDDGGGNGWGQGVLTFSPGGKLLLRHKENALVLWQLDEQCELAALEHEGPPGACRFTPDGRMLLVTVGSLAGRAEENQIVLWDIETRKIVQRLEQSRSCVDLEFSPDGATLVTSTVAIRKGDPLTNKVTVWSTATGDEQARLEIDKRSQRHRVQNATLDFSPDGKRMLTASHLGITIWNTDNWQRLRLLAGSPDTGAARLSPDGRRVFAACQGSSIDSVPGVRVWDVETSKTIAMATFDRSQDERGGCWFTLAPDGQSLVTAARISERSTKRHRRGIMKLWEVASGRETILQTSNEGVGHHWGAAAFSPDSACLAIASWQGRPEIKLIDTKYMIAKQTFDMTLDEDAKEPASVWYYGVHGVRFSPDGRWLAATRGIPRSIEHEVFLWDLQPDAEVHHDESARKK